MCGAARGFPPKWWRPSWESYSTTWPSVPRTPSKRKHPHLDLLRLNTSAHICFGFRDGQQSGGFFCLFIFLFRLCLYVLSDGLCISYFSYSQAAKLDCIGKLTCKSIKERFWSSSLQKFISSHFKYCTLIGRYPICIKFYNGIFIILAFSFCYHYIPTYCFQ